MEGLGEEGEGIEGRPHLFMLSISMGCLAASLSNSDFRMAVWAGADDLSVGELELWIDMNYIHLGLFSHKTKCKGRGAE